MTRTIRSSARRRGVAAVEFAVVMPLYLILMIGVWEVGRMLEIKEIVSNAAREGGRQASMGIKDTMTVRRGVLDYFVRAGISTAGMSVDNDTHIKIENLTAPTPSSSTQADPTQAKQMDRLRVTVSLPYRNVRWTSLSLFGTDDATLITATTVWNSMMDIPIDVPTNVPQ